MWRRNGEPTIRSTGGLQSMIQRIGGALAGVAVGLLFLWLALRGIDWAELQVVASGVRYPALAAGVVWYLMSIAVRCLRWGILLRATGSVKWRHASEALLIGFAANYVLPGRIGELFRAEYARLLFGMSRLTSLGTIIVERVCDGVILVAALWIALLFLSELAFFPRSLSWMLTVAAVSSIVFGAAFLFLLFSRGGRVRRFGPHWSRLIDGVSSVGRGNIAIVVALSLGVWIFEILALQSILRAFTESFSITQVMLLIALGSLSTLVPTAPAYIGTFQFVYAQVFALLGQQPSTGIVVATAMQIFCFGSVTMLGALVLLSRGGIMMGRAFDYTAAKDGAASDQTH
jgi:uncharacterized membrane protein YbhN (UPF0104 family)